MTEWSGSSHARAETSPTYRAMRARAPAADACDRCHAPLAAALGRADPAVAEGVSCEVCHTIADVALAPRAASWALRLAERRKYGPLCDAAEPYFHRAGCSPLHTESRLCAACHHLGHPLADGSSLPVFSEFEEWQHGEVVPGGLQCQGCHMPERRGQAASGGPTREGVSNHGDGPATGDAIKVEAEVLAGPAGPLVRGVVRLSGAPHAVPVGLPGRELALIAELVDRSGSILAHDAVVFSRTLVDAAGVEAPFFAAARVGADTRLQPNEARSFELRLRAAPPGARVELVLEDRRLSAGLARALGIDRPAGERVWRQSFAASPQERAP